MFEIIETWPTGTKIYFYIAVTGSSIYLFKLLSSWIGADTDSEIDVEIENDADFKILTIQTVALFLLAFGWMGFFSTDSSVDVFFSFGIAFLFGIVAVALEIWLFFKIKKLEQIPKFPIEDCIGLMGRVYLTIPEQGHGQVQISVHGKRKIFQAISETGLKIESFHDIKVVGVKDNTLIVKESL